MSESFAELFEESLKTIDMKPGSIVTGIVVDVDDDGVQDVCCATDGGELYAVSGAGHHGDARRESHFLRHFGGQFTRLSIGRHRRLGITPADVDQAFGEDLAVLVELAPIEGEAADHVGAGFLEGAQLREDGRHAQSAAQREFLDVEPFGDPGDHPRRLDKRVEPEDLAADVGYQPATPIEEGVRRFVDWYIDYYRIDLDSKA